MKIAFCKMSGSGNDFIIIDNRDRIINTNDCREFVRSVCMRKYSVGADGVILIENDDEVDFKWRFFNSDGSEAEMCGNGGRCAARFAMLMGITKSSKDTQPADSSVRTVAFRTRAGIIKAEIKGRKVKLQMTPPSDIMLNLDLQLERGAKKVNFVNTGVPHTVLILNNPEELQDFDVVPTGRVIRHHRRFQPAGTNVNFVAVTGKNSIMIRTYERGVEDETLACGTGSIASAIITAAHGLVISPVDVKTRGGETLTIHFERHGEHIDNVYLEGSTTMVYEGFLWEESLAPDLNRTVRSISNHKQSKKGGTYV